MLGDNSLDSSDGRDWTLAQYNFHSGPREGEVLSGNNRPIPKQRGRATPSDGNPIEVQTPDAGTRIFFRDVNGERHVFMDDEVRALSPTTAPFVPRSLIRGRAVVVVWPFSFKHDVYRWKWVR